MIDTLASQIIGFSLQGAPTVWELMNDAHGDHNKRFDIKVRAALMAGVALVNSAINDWRLVFFLVSLNLSLAFFFMFFDYTIAMLLMKNKVVEGGRGRWYDYLSKVKKVDNWKTWAGLDYWTRFMIRFAYFSGSVVLYFTI